MKRPVRVWSVLEKVWSRMGLGRVKEGSGKGPESVGNYLMKDIARTKTNS